MNWKLFLALVVLGLILVVIVQNTQVVTLRLLFWQITLSRIILISLSVIVGFIAGYAVARFTGRPR